MGMMRATTVAASPSVALQPCPPSSEGCGGTGRQVESDHSGCDTLHRERTLVKGGSTAKGRTAPLGYSGWQRPLLGPDLRVLILLEYPGVSPRGFAGKRSNGASERSGRAAGLPRSGYSTLRIRSRRSGAAPRSARPPNGRRAPTEGRFLSLAIIYPQCRVRPNRDAPRAWPTPTRNSEGSRRPIRVPGKSGNSNRAVGDEVERLGQDRARR